MLNYLIFFECDNTVAVVRQKDITKIEGETAVVGKDLKSFIGKVIASGAASYLHEYIVKHKLTVSAAEEEEEKDITKENSNLNYYYIKYIIFYLFLAI